MWRLCFFLFAFNAFGQTFSPTWFWRPEGDPEWRQLPFGTLPPSWDTDSWFRCDLAVGSDLEDPVLVVGVLGRVRVFMDGVEVSPTARVCGLAQSLPIDDGFSPPHLLYHLRKGTTVALELHGQGYRSSDVSTAALNPHFHLSVASASKLLAKQEELTRSVSRHEMFLFGFCLSFALVHLLLYLNFRNLPTNLYYATFAATASVLGLSFYGVMIVLDYDLWLDTFRAATLILAINQLMAIRLAYSLVGLKACRLYHMIGGLFAVMSIWGIFQPFLIFEVQGSIVIIALAEITRTVATYRKRGGKLAVAGSRVLLWGAIPSGLALLYQLAIFNIPGIPHVSYIDFPVILYAPLPLMMAMSLLLSRFFAQTNRDLQLRIEEIERLSQENVVQERERARLNGENERKNRELEHARALQLSLLPSKMPVVPNFQIGAFMQTATEVGGDYYDFHSHPDGSLLVVVGDATGHGLRAGNMVVATKSILGAYTHIPMPGALLTQLGRDLKRMNFKGMFMAMTAVVVRQDGIHMAVAGMPSALHYQAATGEIHILPRGSLPLGAPVQFSYHDLFFPMAPQDVLLLMSDGLQERFNHAQEMFGIERVIDTFRTNVHHCPNRLIEALIEAAETFSEGENLDDDITLVALRRT